MANYVLQKGQVICQQKMDDFHEKGLAMLGRWPWSLPRPPVRPPPGAPVRPGPGAPVRPGGTGTGRPGGAGPGRPGGAGPGRPGRGGGGSWSARALAVAVGSGLVELWSFKWYILGGFGAYIVLRTGKRFMRRNTPDSSSALPAHFATESADASAVLAGYVKEVLQREGLADLDISTLSTNFGSVTDTKGSAVGYYCVEHLHLKVVNHVNHDMAALPLLDSLDDAFDRLRHMLIRNARQGYRLIEETDESRSCMLSKNGQAVGLFVRQEMSNFGCWDCCNGNIQDAIIVARRYEKLSFMAARRLSNENSLFFDTISDGPEFVIIASDGVCNLMENMNAVRFVYQGVRADMELRPLCDVLLDSLLSSGSSTKMLAIFVKFKVPHLGEGSSVNI